MSDAVDCKAALPVAILLAKSAIAAQPLREMEHYAEKLQASGRVAKALYAFSEQGSPSLRKVVHDLRDEGHRNVLILPMLLPMEPSFKAWITRSLQRWHAQAGGEWPSFRIGRGLDDMPHMSDLLNSMLDTALSASSIAPKPSIVGEGSIVSNRKYRILVCGGGLCNQAGAALLWGHLRNAQAAHNLADKGEGMCSAKASCLGPCALAPVVQVYPDGTFYGGVDETGMDRIINDHLLNGHVVEEYLYRPAPGKQRLRDREK